MLQIVRASDSADNFAQWYTDSVFSALDAHPIFGSFGRRYYPAVFEQTGSDETFAVISGNTPLLLVPCAISDGAFDYYGTPIRFFVRTDGSSELSHPATALALKHIDQIARARGINRVIIGDDNTLGALSVLGEECLGRNYVPSLRLSARAELNEGETGLRRTLRKSYKSLLNWGRQNLAVEIVDSRNPNRAAFDLYKDLHREVAGRSTRPLGSWGVMFEWISRGSGELILASYEGSLVAGTMVIDGATTAFYASGAYQRDNFDKPLTHWPLWLAMLHAYERGMTYFDLGEIHLASAASPKEVNIGYFKRGFATSLVSWIAWTWNNTKDVRTEAVR